MIRKAFLPGAGLGTRLRPLTDLLPKPLVPLFHKPLIGWAMETCAAAGIAEFAINTHHLPERWESLLQRGTGDPAGDAGDGFGAAADGWSMADGPRPAGENGVDALNGLWRGRPVKLFHEPELLDTGGGIRNLASWIDGDPVLVHNGDIFSSMDLSTLIAAHEASGDVVTLALRSDGVAKHIAIDGGRVTDIRQMLGRAPGTHVFSGIHVFSPALLDLIPRGEKVSVIPAFLELARRGKLGAVVLDTGAWFDLGDVPAYLAAHRDLTLAEPIDRRARISPTAEITKSVIGPGAVVGPGAAVSGSVLWPGVRVAAGERIADSVVTPAGVVSARV